LPKPPRAFVAFDYDHDSALRDLLLGQSERPDTNLEMHDWKVRAREKIRASDLAIVLCGTQTHTATGVGACREDK
jgi:hypothetical protein